MNIRSDWTHEELSALYHLPLFVLLSRAADVHRLHHDYTKLDACQLVSVKTGGCPEDCRYCAQSSRYSTSVQAGQLLSEEEVLTRATEAKQRGARRICLGAGQRNVRNNATFAHFLKLVTAISEMGLEVCCTLGMIEKEQLKQLKEAGLFAYNHNIDTSPSFYPNIISTRSFQDRLDTLKNVEEEGIHLCCGGILGMGETIEDRLEMLRILATRSPHPQSVPINRLVPVPGTPLADAPPTTTWEVVRLIATARISMPKAIIRLSAGRSTWSDEQHALSFLAGANSIFLGEKCLTVDNSSYGRDEKLFKLFGLTCNTSS